VLVGGLCAAALILVAPALPAASRRVALGVGAALALLTVLAGPAAYSVETALTPASGSLPSAGPTVAGGRGGPGGFAGGAGPGQGFPGGQPPTGTPPMGGRFPNGGQFPNGGLPGGGPVTGGTGTTGSPGSLLQGSDPSEALTAALLQDADAYTWVAAAVGANTAAGYQLAAQEPVMAIGGFNGSDPSPTLAQFQQYVAEGRIHWFIASGGGPGGGPGGGQMGGSDVATQITAWVTEKFPATTIDGVTLYDLTGTTSATSGTGASSTTSA
jgi:hypothetical protein